MTFSNQTTSSHSSAPRCARWRCLHCWPWARPAPRPWCIALKVARKICPSNQHHRHLFDASEQIYDNLVDFERGGTKVVPGLAESWTVSKDGLEYVFKLRKGVKWQSNKNFKPTRDFNADDILFMFERQWKENDPYFKVTSSNTPTLATWACPNCSSQSTKSTSTPSRSC